MLNHIMRRLKDVCAQLKEAVETFWHRLLYKPGYADAAADLLTYVVQLFCRNWMLIGFVQQIAQAIAALIREAIRSRQPEDALPWQFA